MTSHIAVLGSANMDLVVTAPRLPRPGETLIGAGFATVPGGKGANQAIAAARAGAAVTFLGAVGTDAFGTELTGTLVEAGVDVAALRRVPGPTGVALVTVDRAGENTIVVVPGANAALTELTAAETSAIRAAHVLLCQLETPLDAVTAAAATASAAGTLVVLNAAPARALPDDLLALVDVLAVNEHEAATVAGATGSAEEVVDALLSRVPEVVLTLGAAGVRHGSRDGGQRAVAAPKVSAVDTTAAGDAFTGAFAVARAEGRAVMESLAWACAAGAVCATRAGASSALPTRAEIDACAAAAAA